MQIATSPTNVNPFVKATDTTDAAQSALMSSLSQYQIIRRNGAVVPFEPAKIAVAMMKAFLAVHGTQGAASSSVRETVDQLTQVVTRALMRSRPGGGTFHIEDVQDQVELGLMRSSNHEVARAYVLYRERRTQERSQQNQQAAPVVQEPALHVLDGGKRIALDLNYLKSLMPAPLFPAAPVAP
jgi:ribonucleoside-diphosphate reductase alpha chain